MTSTNLTTQQQRQQEDEKTKVAYALNLCAVSISQIIDSEDIFVLKQEREAILNNLNLQNFVKHPALLDVLKQILDTITYLEIQAGDLTFIEKEYQHKLGNAIWSAIPSPGALFAGGSPVSIAIAVAAQIGTGYMNYRRNKSQYELGREKSMWELRRHEIEQLEGLRALLFETAWKLSDHYNFPDQYRLTQKQLSRYSEALLEEDPLKRYERLDVMSDKFAAFPPFWYYKGNAAMEVFHDKKYSAFSEGFKAEALKAYNEFHKRHFEFLREDVITASCCIEHISLLDPYDVFAETLLRQALRLAGDNYDVLQQSILVNLQLKKDDEVIIPLRKMVANGYNLGLNSILLSRIYFNKSSRVEYEKLRAIAGDGIIPSWSDDPDTALERLKDAHVENIANEYLEMAERIRVRLTGKSLTDAESIFADVKRLSPLSLGHAASSKEELKKYFEIMENKLNRAIISANSDTLSDFHEATKQLGRQLRKAKFSPQIVEQAPDFIDKIKKVAK
jgi:hypothetical protein